MSSSIALRRSPKPGALTATAVKVPRILLTTRVDSASPSTSSATMNSGLDAWRTFSSSGSRSCTERDLALVDQDVGVLEDGLHPLRVGDEVRRQVALVELHALGEVELHRGGRGLLDGDDAVLADLVERLGDQLADAAVLRGDGRDVGDVVLAVDLAGGVEQRARETASTAALMPLFRPVGDGAGRDVAQALVHQRLGEHGGGRGAVTGDVVGLGRHLLGELGAEVLVRVLELDLAGDGDAVVGDGGGAPLLVDDDVAALRAERHLDRVRERVDAALERAAGVVVELQGLGHVRVLLGVGCCELRLLSDDAPVDPAEPARPGRSSAVRCEQMTAFTSVRTLSRPRPARRGPRGSAAPRRRT